MVKMLDRIIFGFTPSFYPTEVDCFAQLKGLSIAPISAFDIYWDLRSSVSPLLFQQLYVFALSFCQRVANLDLMAVLVALFRSMKLS